MTTAIWWIRRDLRLCNNAALQLALSKADTVVPVFIMDPYLLDKSAPARSAYLFKCLQSLSDDLHSKGTSLVIRSGQPDLELERLCRESGTESIIAEADYSPYAERRDRKVAASLPLTLLDGLTIKPPGTILKPNRSPYTVFTPFRRAWLAGPEISSTSSAPQYIEAHTELPSLPIPNIPSQSIFPTNETTAQQRLHDFLERDIADYHTGRDRLDLPATSFLSPCFRFGLLSIKDAYAQARQLFINPYSRDGISAWLDELIWREFFFHIMAAYPYVLKSAFRENLRHIPWHDNPAELQAWKDGLTGYPVVDASMRQLSQSGWMHNRARMITASFLTKDLLINWQIGERWFMDNLLDGDPASNNGGWQWCAGTGTDAAPYFRVFNPILQSRKFDPSGNYIRTWLPELCRVPETFIHEPWRMPLDIQSSCNTFIGKDYPKPIVEHAFARERALTAYKNAA
jgi:deoxyribodipyrimidine photo-lyase